MVSIGLLSDTHGYLDPAVFNHFKTCDEIWHAGDFGSVDVAKELASFKPLKGVYGNIDGQELRRDFREDLRFKCENVTVWITHIGGYPGKYSPRIKPLICTDPPQLFISGHSHILKVMFDKKLACLHMNPGAAGKQGWHKIRTLLRFKIDGAIVRDVEAIELLK